MRPERAPPRSSKIVLSPFFLISTAAQNPGVPAVAKTVLATRRSGDLDPRRTRCPFTLKRQALLYGRIVPV